MRDQSPNLASHFLSVYQNHHNPGNHKHQVDQDFLQAEKVFMSTFQVGHFELYEFLYQNCRDGQHFTSWLIDLKGKSFFDEAMWQFNQWLKLETQVVERVFNTTLSIEQHDFWNQNGYLKIGKVIDADRCNSIVDYMLQTLNMNIDVPDTWYNDHPVIQGMMVQLYQGDVFDSVRQDPFLKSIFSSLYGHENIIPNCDKVSFNAPVNEHYTFKGSALHWDIDFNVGPKYYIQGLIYLNDVPFNRGPLTLIPGYHHKLADTLARFSDHEAAMASLRKEKMEIPVSGEQGDLIVWLESLPHAASANYSELPRFVHYVSFSEL